uniref:Uncharacterized protein n=1 Tax=Rhizophora mucronata TaxID=61149 RepID=A0A2P2QYJ5_RHIMU
MTNMRYGFPKCRYTQCNHATLEAKYQSSIGHVHGQMLFQNIDSWSPRSFLQQVQLKKCT